ncbi:MAG: hypothetical protein AAB821_01155 [Patescibacteria group bacterium]
MGRFNLFLLAVALALGFVMTPNTQADQSEVPKTPVAVETISAMLLPAVLADVGTQAIMGSEPIQANYAVVSDVNDGQGSAVVEAKTADMEVVSANYDFGARPMVTVIDNTTTIGPISREVSVYRA